MVDPIMVARVAFATFRRMLPVVILVITSLTLFIQHQRIGSLKWQLATAGATIQAKQAEISARDVEIKTLSASMVAAQQEAEARASAAQRAMVEARNKARRHEAEIERVKAFRPATGDECQDALMRIREYRSRQ